MMTVNQNVEAFAKEWSGKDINSVKEYWGEFVPALRELIQMERNDALREAVKKIESLETVVGNGGLVECPYMVMRNFDCNRGHPHTTTDTDKWYYKFFNEYSDASEAMHNGEVLTINRNSYDGIVWLTRKDQ